MKSVDSPQEVEFHTCAVHRLIDADEAPRLCKWCNACKEWICSECWHAPKRIAAAAKAWLGRPNA